MADAGDFREVAVTVWRGSGDAVLASPQPASVRVDLTDDSSLGNLITAVAAGTGLKVALRRLTETDAHVEVLGKSPSHTWRDGNPAVVGDEQPWYGAGWYSATAALIEAKLSELGVRMTGPLVQYKHWSISAVLSVDTTDGRFWFKQVPPFMSHEGRLIRWIRRLQPALVPDVVAVGSDWALMREFPEHVGGNLHDSPFGALAVLQREAAATAGELLALGCPDRRFEVLRQDLLGLVERGDLVDDRVREQLAAALPAVEACIDKLVDLGIQNSVVHGDLHGGNWIRRKDGSWLIFDWTDGCMAHPFMDLGVISSRDPDVRRARVQQYLASWQAMGVSGDVLHRVATAAEPLAAGFHAVSYQRIVDNLDGSDAPSWKPVVTSFLKRLLDLV